MSARNKHGECPCCGRHARLTRDHIPPRALFRRRPQHQLLTVMCCSACNGAASLDDQYFGLNLALLDDVGQEADIIEIVPAVLRSLGRPEAPGLRAEFLGALHEAPVTTLGGLFGKQAGIQRRPRQDGPRSEPDGQSLVLPPPARKTTRALRGSHVRRRWVHPRRTRVRQGNTSLLCTADQLAADQPWQGVFLLEAFRR